MKSLVELKLYPEIGIEVKKMIRHRDTTSLDELFTILSEIISSKEACEVSSQFQNLASSSSNQQQQS